MKNVPEDKLSPLQNVVVNLAHSVKTARELGDRLRSVNNSLSGLEGLKDECVDDPAASPEVNGSIDDLTRSLTYLNYNLGEITRQIFRLEQTV